MKKVVFVLLACVAFCSCSEDKYKKQIRDFFEINDGIKTDLDIKIKDLTVKDITVADSIAILKARFEDERNEKIESLEKSIAYYLGAKEKYEAQKGDIVAGVLVSKCTDELAKFKKDLVAAENWRPEYLERYEDEKNTKVLAQLVEAHVSLYNPKIQTRQEKMTKFIFTPDGSQCLRMTK